jgi:hypothetical protein
LDKEKIISEAEIAAFRAKKEFGVKVGEMEKVILG